MIVKKKNKKQIPNNTELSQATHWGDYLDDEADLEKESLYRNWIVPLKQ